jgi:hypothetical protein
MPALSSQNAVLYVCLSAVAFCAQAAASVRLETWDASSAAVVRTYMTEAEGKQWCRIGMEKYCALTLYRIALPSALCPPPPCLAQSRRPVTFIKPELSTLLSRNATAFV